MRLLRQLQGEQRPAGAEEQLVLARWSGWGAAPAMFDDSRGEYAAERAELRQLLPEAEWKAAARTTLNAHYTDTALVRAIWETLEEHGFAGTAGRVLEPGCGAGAFLGLAPDSARDLVGVELDPTTAAIAAALYPHATIRAESFADTRLPSSSFDLVIGNVPFADVVLHDPAHNSGRHPIHTHFILKSLALTRPGGVVAVITSRWTMDTANPAARREIAQRADLVAAIRLPITAHERAAGTKVVTDLLVLRRRAAGEEPAGLTGWEQAVNISTDPAGPVPVNRYFVEHPDAVIGQLATRLGRFGPESTVDYAGGDIADQLRARLQVALADYASTRPVFGPPGPDAPERVALADAPAEHLDGHLAPDGSAGFTVVQDGRLVPHQVPASQARELTALLGLRDTVLNLLAAEAATLEDTAEISELRAQLNTRYADYVARFGPINRTAHRSTGRLDAETGQPRMARIRPAQGGFRSDPHSPAVYALELYDEELNQAEKASIFTQRVVAPRVPQLGADTPEDALAICLDTHGRVELAEIARLLGRIEDEALTELAGLVYADPAQAGQLVPAAEYLSGNVRIKLAQARAAAEPTGDDRWAGNIAALEAVIPADLTPAEISVRLGAAWIPANVVEQFLTELLDDPSIRVENPGGSTWAVRGAHHSVLASSTYGTGRVSAVKLAEACLEQRPIRVTDELEDGRRILNLTETVAAQEKADELQDAFADWLWTDPHRTRGLSRAYNDRFNAIVLRSYDGAQRDFPGLAVSIRLRPHQVAAVVRMLSEPTAGLFHEVGAGKTLEMIVGCMELRRLGIKRKPAVVVPNHMLEQFSREWLQAYPQARVLACGVDDLAGERRKLLVARVATSDWDAVILSRSAFERLPLSPEAQQAYHDREVTTLAGQLEASRQAGGISVKRIEATLARAEERIKKLLSGQRDPGVRFEQTGIDYLFVDEAHDYKNLRVVSNIPGAAIDGSQRASDLDMKLHYLRQRHGDRVATFATATPIANSIAEAYVMQRYLQPDVLEQAGITDFDTWAATFGETVTALELSPDGSQYRLHSRFAKFRNVPELLRMFHLVADVKTAADLNLPTPALVDGKAQTAVVPPSIELRAFMARLVERAEQVRAKAVRPEEDNMLRVATHGRMAALDLRLLPPGELVIEGQALLTAGLVEGKLTAAADRIAAIHHAHADRSYPGQARTGALQLVFCDLGTPSGAGWDAYTELRQLLAARGVPAGTVRFMHEARNDREKGQLFAAARAGKVSVLIGSTQKMGVGTNVQLRAYALHHLDCPWRPADLAQRDGRILRQGNLNPEVEVIRWISEASFDAYSWQTVERKARFIDQVMRGRLDVREIDDISDTALSYAEVKALATGDERILEQAQLDAEIARLERLQRSHNRNQVALRATVDAADRELPRLADDLDQLTAALEARTDTRGEAFSMTVAGQRHAQRVTAAVALHEQLLAIHPGDATHPIGRLAGFDLHAHARRQFGELHYELQLAGVPRTQIAIPAKDLAGGNPLGLIARLENRAVGIEAIRAEITERVRRTSIERDRAVAQLDQPFPHTDALTTSRTRAAQLADQLSAKARDLPAAADSRTEDRWQTIADRIRPQLTQSASWTPLRAALNRATAAGIDADALLTQLVAEHPPMSADPAGDMLWRLYERCEAAAPTADDITLHTAPALNVCTTEEPPRACPTPVDSISF
ncbi:MAG TPA: methyltransferase domain-containing protein [Kineosporiaceae bacterium]|nr:methyltransferase domain-containing protein [Kineosporiaceae bacterium]